VTELTAAAGAMRNLIDYLKARGIAREALEAEAGLAPGELDRHDARIPLEKSVALMRAGQKLSGDPALALHYAGTVDLSEFSVVGLLVQASETVGEAIAQLNRYGRLLSELGLDGADRFRFAARGGSTWLVDARPAPNDVPEHTEAAFARLASLRPPGDRRFIRSVELTYRDPGYRCEYELLFRAPVRFRSEWNAIEIDPSWPAHRLARQPRYVFGILGRHADSLLDELERSKTMSGRVESILMPILHTGEASMERVATALGLGTDTLYRRLKREGATFEQLLDGLRRRLALHYLAGRRVSVHETAYLLGFSDPAAFSRAFKRWTGKCPSAVRLDEPGTQGVRALASDLQSIAAGSREPLR
jgi:AraC-like DNA-binding protein